MTISNELTTKLNGYIPIIAYAVGYDITDAEARTFVEAIVNAGAEDMLRSGVPEARC